MTTLNIKEPAIPFGSWVVISGVSGFIGSHVADQALAAGYKVRGTTRSVQKSDWIKKHFEEKYGLGNFELVEVPDMAAEGAFDRAVTGAAGFIHVANDMTSSSNASIAIPSAVNGALNALRAAASEPSMKRFVYTSSSFAATLPKPDQRFTVTAETFNEEATERAWGPDADGDSVYCASKVEAERAIARWVKENNSPLVVNAILPNANIGPLISATHQGYPTTARWTKALWDSDYASLSHVPPQHYINVQDDARLHIIGLADPAVQGERIFAVAGPFNLNDILGVLRRLYPGKTWEDYPDDRRDLSTFEPMTRAEALLEKAYGRGFVGLEESVKGNVAELVHG
ncbi:NAD(P)-binding protein [Aspergillus carlsbadensis]|nr:NAD(P)-binding protein [Aspergillus carlsbadensis]